jgi:hypothetical protein
MQTRYFLFGSRSKRSRYSNINLESEIVRKGTPWCLNLLTLSRRKKRIYKTLDLLYSTNLLTKKMT